MKNGFLAKIVWILIDYMLTSKVLTSKHLDVNGNYAIIIHEEWMQQIRVLVESACPHPAIVLEATTWLLSKYQLGPPHPKDKFFE